MADRDYSPHQQKIIKRYYQNFDAIKGQRLADLTSELYLTEGKAPTALETGRRDLDEARLPDLSDRASAPEARPGAPAGNPQGT